VGGFTGGNLVEPKVVNLSKLNDGQYVRMTELIDEIKQSRSNGECIQGDFFYEISIAFNSSSRFFTVYKGKSFTPHPKCILEIEEMAEQQDLRF